VRHQIATTITFTLLYQMPIPRLISGNPAFDAIVPLAARLTCTRREFAGLWQSVIGTAWDESSGATDAAERLLLRDAIDARVAHLYGLTRADYAHILGTFPLVFPPGDAGDARRRWRRMTRCEGKVAPSPGHSPLNCACGEGKEESAGVGLRALVSVAIRDGCKHFRLHDAVSNPAF
jgi:hypothetical protein